MRYWLLVLGILLTVAMGRADDFPSDFSPTFKFHETYRDAVMSDPDFPGDFLVASRGDLSITAVASLSGFDTNTLDYFSPYEIGVGDFDQSGELGDDFDYDPSDPDFNHSVNIELEGYTLSGDFDVVGNVTINWATGGRVTFGVSVHDDPLDWTIATSDYYPDVDDPAINRDDLLATLAFGPFTLDLQTVYMIGTASVSQDPQGRVPDDLSNVDLYGSVDNVAPSVSITSPPPPPAGTSKTTITVNDSPNGFYTLSGTSSDTYSVNNLTFPGTINSVQVKLGATSKDGTFVDAQLDNQGNWVLPNVQIFTGNNVLTVTATDDSGNTKTVTRQFIYSLKGNVTVTADASGYPPGAQGSIAGTVSGSFFKTASRKITMVVGQTAPTDVTNQNAGDNLTVTATPGPGSVFNGWIGVINGNTVLDEVTSKLTFGARPDMTLTAKFVPNPFTGAVIGKYQGLVNGANAASRGLIKFSLSKTGTFSGSVRVGTLNLPVHGVLLGNGLWRGTVKKGKNSYDITLTLNVGAAGDRQLTGTVQGTGVDATLVADLVDWKKKTNEATAYVGTYNALLPPSDQNADVNFPIGVGFARISIAKTGAVRMLGKLGDGSPLSASATLVRRASGPVVIPLYLPQDHFGGAVSGTLTYDNSKPTSDLSGDLDWTEPVSGKVEPQSFTGQISLTASLYTKPAPGARVLFDASAGQFHFDLEAPLFTKPVRDDATPLGPFEWVETLNASTNSFGPVNEVGAFGLNLKFNTSTGLFTGSYHDDTFNKTIPFFGIASQKAGRAGGVFIRGNRAGAVSLKP